VIAIARIAGVDRVGLLTEDGKHLPVAGLGKTCESKSNKEA
jgi:hypothetical protein